MPGPKPSKAERWHLSQLNIQAQDKASRRRARAEARAEWWAEHRPSRAAIVVQVTTLQEQHAVERRARLWGVILDRWRARFYGQGAA